MNQPHILKSAILVIIQFGCLGLIALTGPILPANIFLLIVELLGLGIGAWAVVTIGIGRFNILPDPLRHSRLVQRGPYRLIRHPMYLGLLLATLPLVVAEFTALRLAIWAVLLADLIVKLHYEEGMLLAQLEDYKGYLERSFRLIPFIY